MFTFYKTINFRNYEILKMISEQLRLLSWAIGGLFGIISNQYGIYIASIYIIVNWATLQLYSMFILNIALKYKKENSQC